MSKYGMAAVVITLVIVALAMAGVFPSTPPIDIIDINDPAIKADIRSLAALEAFAQVVKEAETIKEKQALAVIWGECKGRHEGDDDSLRAFHMGECLADLYKL